MPLKRISVAHFVGRQKRRSQTDFNFPRKVGSLAQAIAEVDAKVRALAKPRNFTFRPVLIHVNGVDDGVEEAGYFDAIIDFGELWR